MIDNQQRVPRSGRIRAVLSAGAILGLGAVGTLAGWTDSATATTGEFSTAAGEMIEISLNGSAAPSTFADFNVSGLNPGESKAAILQVSNTGDGDFTYTSTVQTTGPEVLAQNLTLTVRRGGTVSGTTCTDGTEVSSFKLDQSIAQPKDTTGAPQAVGVGQSDDLCVQVQLANPVTKTASNQFVTTKFRFTAEGQD